jgi:hypothetical protein
MKTQQHEELKEDYDGKAKDKQPTKARK